MSDSPPSLLVETDLIADYLLAPAGEPPLLRRLLEVAVCHATFIQASEIYGVARTPEEQRTVERALFGLRILGVNSRYSKTIGAALSSVGRSVELRTAIVAAVAIESRMPVVTGVHVTALSEIEGVRIIPAESLKRAGNAAELAELLAAAG